MCDGVARNRFDVLQLLLQLRSGKPLERRVGDDSPYISIDWKQPRGARTRQARGNATR
jgi:hypothetical protein